MYGNLYTAAFDLKGGFTVKGGIAAKYTQRKYSVLLKCGLKRLSVPIAPNVEIIRNPITDEDWIYEAELTRSSKTSRKYKFSPVSQPLSTTIVLLKSDPALILNPDWSPVLKESVIRIGGEGGQATVQIGGHQSPHKQQVFALAAGDHVLVVDSTKTVGKLTAGKPGEKPSLNLASREEIGDYALQYARRASKHRQAVRWSEFLLKELAVQHLLDEFNAEFN